MLSERLEVRIDQKTLELLKEAADRHSVSVGEIVRRALDALLVEEDRQARIEAAERLCSYEFDDDYDWEKWEEEYTRSKLEGM